MRRALLGASAAGAFLAVTPSFQSFDAWLSSTLGGTISSSIGEVASGTAVLVIPESHTPFFALITPSCSSAAPLAVIALIGLMMTRSWSARSLAGLAVAATAVVFANLVRLVSVMLIGATFGRSPMAAAHDWLGTSVTLAGLTLGIAIVLRANRRPRASAGGAESPSTVAA